MDEAKLKKWVEREEEKEKPGHPTQSIMDNMIKDNIISLHSYQNNKNYNRIQNTDMEPR
jgi:hypothetical protein